MSATLEPLPEAVGALLPELVTMAGGASGGVAIVGSRAGERGGVAGALGLGEPPPTFDAWYDLASLTKVLCTVPLLLEQIAAGRIDPHLPLRELLPIPDWRWMAEPNLGAVTVLQLATHTSGLPGTEPLFALGLDRRTLLMHVLHMPIVDPAAGQPPVVYSDPGYIVLAHVLERVTGEPLERLAERLYARLGLDGMLGFAVPSDVAVAPMGMCSWRGRSLRGEVSDKNAAALAGVSGHAGLFGTARGVAGMARALLDGRLHPEPVVRFLATEHARTGEDRRGFGWSLPAPGWSGGELMSERSVGHIGYTGTGVWIDLERERYSVLLLNRVDPLTPGVPDPLDTVRRRFNAGAHA